jgi:hypothetical protein
MEKCKDYKKGGVTVGNVGKCPEIRAKVATEYGTSTIS